MITLSLESLTKTAQSRPAGYLEDVLSRATVDGDRVTMTMQAYFDLVAKYRGVGPSVKKQPGPGKGPGTELKALLKKIGITSSPGCACNARARKMDMEELKQPGWCADHLEEIVDWLQEEATKRRLPFLRAAGRVLVRKAISNAGKKGQ